MEKGGGGGIMEGGTGMRWRRKNVQEGGGGAIIACVIVGENLNGPAVWNNKNRLCSKTCGIDNIF